MLHLAFVDQCLDGASDVFDGHVRIDAVLVQKVDGLDPEPPERALDALSNVLGTAVESTLAPIALDLEPELGRDYHLISKRGQRIAHQFLVRERAVDRCGVEERHAAFDGGANHCNPMLPVSRLPVAEAESHGAVADRRHVQIAMAQFAFLHRHVCQSFCLP